MDEILSKTITLPKTIQLTTEIIESELNCDIIRWAITEVSESSVKITLTYRQK